ncbi:RND family efflux transporter MFP subunit [Methylosinus sp. sav-2]|uniref:efflux RND transporter periplasmic adaptor subunit n=1 Tax=Methylosinus sp. sav-2 TaxID=2485168 RepID=UPI000B01AFB5|nr:efflux RND transporter periplasmic adaptor subunit [Methylosinus sp. sav-2]TDX61817.1 RND family efflux transporter MFP subunit [Methylosinus sp. sav-2]
MRSPSQEKPNNPRTSIARTVIAAALAMCSASSASAGRAENRRIDCVIDPTMTVKLGSPTAGLVSEVLVDRGDVVVAGQVVARLESSVEAATLELNRARAASAARVEAQAARLTLSRARMGRARELLARNSFTRDKFDEQRADTRVAEEDLAREKVELRLAELEVERSRALLEQRTIRSPIAGVIGERKLSPGEFVHQDTFIMSVVHLDPLHVEAFLPVAMYPKIKIGEAVMVSPDEPVGGSHLATVSVIDRVFDPASATFGVRLLLPNPDNRLPGGQRCKLDFDEAARERDAQ